MDKYDWKEPDWNREKYQKIWEPNKKLLRSIRKYQGVKTKNIFLKKLLQKYYSLNHIFWSIITGADIPINTILGGGLLIPHPNGIVIHPSSIIGPNCLIFQQVTLAGKVILGSHVDIGAGAKLIGPIKIGNNVIIGANSVVVKDVENDQTVIGIPAKPIHKK